MTTIDDDAVREAQMRAHRLASEIAGRFDRGEALGRPSVYNIAREVLIADAVRRAADEPDGYFVSHTGQNFVVHFGPFDTVAEAHRWLDDNPTVRGAVQPLYRTVDWNRR